MALYTVHIPGNGEVERAVFLRDGFSWGAFVFGPMWLLMRGAWISGTAVVLGILISVAALQAYGVGAEYLAILVLLLMLFLGFEATSLIRLDLKLRRYSLAGVVAAVKPEDAEARFFASYLDVNGTSPLPIATGSSSPPGPLSNPGILGSFPHPVSGGRTGP